jgi:hypothetical protein
MAIVKTSLLNENSYRPFPYHDSADRVATNTGWVVPDSLLADLAISVPFDFNPTEMYISNILVAGSVAKITISSTSHGVVAFCVFDYIEHDLYESYAVRGSSNFPNIYGRLTAGFIDVNSNSMQAGEHVFDFQSGRLALSCIRPIPRSVNNIRVAGQVLSGEINLVEGRGVSISADSGNNSLTISANLQGAISLEDCGCIDEPKGIKTINGVEPDEFGNITLEGTNCLELVLDPGLNKIRLVDTCSQPCCDCEGLTVMARNIDTLREKSLIVEDFVRDIRSKLSTAAEYLRSRSASGAP